MGSNLFLELITGPFGTRLAQALASLTKKVLILCSSNAALDALTRKLKELNEDLMALRFHSINTETSNLKQKAPATYEAYRSQA